MAEVIVRVRVGVRVVITGGVRGRTLLVFGLRLQLRSELELGLE